MKKIPKLLQVLLVTKFQLNMNMIKNICSKSQGAKNGKDTKPLPPAHVTEGRHVVCAYCPLDHTSARGWQFSPPERQLSLIKTGT